MIEAFLNLEFSYPQLELAMPGLKSVSSKEMTKWISRLRDEFEVSVSDGEVIGVRMLKDSRNVKYKRFSSSKSGSLVQRVREEIEEFIEGTRRSFDLPMNLKNLTSFSQDVLQATMKIPYGETRSYKWVAETSGHPKALRAVGQVQHRNPIPILIP